MRYQDRLHITREYVRANDVNLDYLYREMANKIIKNMSFEDLEKMFVFKSIDPWSEINKAILEDKSQPDTLKDHIRHLQQIDVIEFEANLYIP